jgi:ABC-2 type transport system permease protein
MVAAQTRVELLLALRRGESVLVTMVVPTLLLLFFGTVAVLPTGTGRPVDFLLPGILALAIMSTAMVSLGIATAYERHYRVLKRLGGSPLPRAGLLLAKIAAVLAIELIQVVLLFAVATLVFGWRPTGNPGLTLLALLLGTSAFGGLGLALAGVFRAEATLAAANGLYLIFLLLGGIVFPLSALPTALAAPAGLLPAAALAETLRAGLAPDIPAPLAPLALLAFWALATPIAAARTFRWE